MNERWVDPQSLAEFKSSRMEWLALEARPELKLISTTTAAEATIATHRQVGDEVARRIAAAERAATSHAAPLAMERAEADQSQDLFHRDASA